MAVERTNPVTGDGPAADGGGGPAAPYRRRKAVRVLVPVGVAGLAAVSVGLVPALASGGSPKLPRVTAEQLVARVLASDVQAMSGTVRTTADLGLPAGVLDGGLPGGGGFGGRAGGDGAPGGADRGGAGAGGGGQDGTAAPEAQLTRLLAGTHTLQVAVDGPDRQRLGLIDRLAEYEIVHDGTQVWGWDSRTNRAVHLVLPAGRGDDRQGGSLHGDARGARPFAGGRVPATPQEAARQVLGAAGSTTAVSVTGTSRVAGQDAYELSVRPKGTGSTVGEVRISVDAANGVPLRVRVVPAGGGSPAFDVGFTSVSFHRPASRTFAFTPPKGSEVTEHRAAAGDLPGTGPGTGPGRPGAQRQQPGGGVDVVGQGWTSVVSLRLPAGADEGPLALLKGFGKPVGGGTLLHTRLVNALVTDDGRVYAGAVSPQVLRRAATGGR
ncbi:outer membrane lipoprotein carrier protein LolA [Streptomyces sp. NPDC001380]|uniref:LolA family protein n=1 Tax=Streptomyces sp. NPDC001380 TaxID=3364566 RepID=UPI0036C9A671